MKLKKTAIILLSAIPSIALVHIYLDEGIASFIAGLFTKTPLFSPYLSSIPDLLMAFTVVGTMTSWIAQSWCSRKGVDKAYGCFFHLTAWTIPLSFLAKAILKPVFGKVTTRAWLKNPDLYGFHWLQAEGDFSGFPSGHMAVFTVCALAAWRFFPRYRIACTGFLILLAASLMLTSYHFLSDVLAGALMGVLVDACVYRIIFSRKDSPCGGTPGRYPTAG